MENITDGPSGTAPEATSAYRFPDFLKGMAALLRPYWQQGLLIFLTVSLQLAFSLAVPLAMKVVFDRAVGENDFGVLFNVFLFLIIGFVVFTVASLGQDSVGARLGITAVNNLRLKLLDHLHQLSPSFYNRIQSGDLISRFATDLTAIENAITRGLPRSLYNLLQMVVSLVLVFLIEWRLALLITIAAPIITRAPRRFGSRATDASFTRQTVEGKISSLVQENINGHKIVTAFGLASTMRSRFQAGLAELAEVGYRAHYLGALVGRLTDVGVQLLFLLILGVGGYLALLGFMTVGDLFAFLALLANVARGSRELVDLVPNLIQAAGSLQRVDEILAEQPQVVDAPAADPLPPFSQAIQFKDVDFSYQADGQRSLKQLNLTIPKGQTSAFVGTSGSGKSTILNLLTRFYDPQTGTVTIDNHNLQQITQSSLHSQIGIVFQDAFLFNASIRDNIGYGQLGASEEAIETAARQAQIHDVILGFPDGYDTLVGEGGSNLSGGQRQRIALARALLRQPAILALDEATSALDLETEAAVNASLRELANNGCTILSVTHRLGATKDMGHIFVLEAGELVEAGSHKSLLQSGGKYAQLLSAQDRWQTMMDANLA
ncbi:MAG: ABC transporter ATP-binding protein [Chloroflexota bacterium]